MKIVLTGGGSGGHITPLLAVAHELKVLEPAVELIYIGQKGDKLADVVRDHPEIDQAYAVKAGKFRRYGFGLKQLIYWQTNLKNVRDACRVLAGTVTSYRLLKKLQPDLIFIKGGFVGVPVGLAAARLGIPYITHDSDAIPGLANRIIAKWAVAHAVAMPKEVYPYPSDKTYTVGVPIQSDFRPVSIKEMQEYRNNLGLAPFKQVVFVTGGGNGAVKLNEAVLSITEQLLTEFPKAALVHIAGRDHESKVREEYQNKIGNIASRVFVKGFVHDLYQYSGAADVIIGRGSATNLAEFAMQRKACIIIPAAQLIWTVKNAQALAEKGAAIIINEDSIVQSADDLLKACRDLLNDPGRRQQLGQNLEANLAHPSAAHDLAELLVECSKNNSNTNVSEKSTKTTK